MTYKDGCSDIMVYDIEKKIIEKVSSDIDKTYGELSFDGNIIAWIDRSNGDGDIWIYDISRKEEKRLTYSLGEDKDVVVENGKVIWLEDYNGYSQVYMYDVHSDSEIKLTNELGKYRIIAFSGDLLLMTKNNKRVLIDMKKMTEQSIALPVVRYLDKAFITGNQILWSDTENLFIDSIDNVLTGESKSIYTDKEKVESNRLSSNGINYIGRLFTEAKNLQQQSNKDKAIEKYKEIVTACDELLDKSPDGYSLFQAMYYKGRSLYELGLSNEAEAYLKTASEISENIYENKRSLNNKLASINYYLGRVQFIKGNKDGALENVEKALDLQRDYVYSNKLKDDPVFSSIKGTDEFYNLIGVLLVIDNKPIWGIKTVVQNGEVLTSAWEVAESLGAKVELEESTKTVTIYKLGKKLTLQVGSNVGYENDKKITLPAAPILIEKYYVDPVLRNDSILIPVNFVAKALGQKVSRGESQVYEELVQPAIIIVEDESKIKYSEDQRKWALAPSTNINLYNYGGYNIIGGNYRFRAHVLSVRSALEGGWNIYSREDYFAALKWLKEEGHNKYYRDIEAELSAFNPSQLETIMKKDQEISQIVKFYIKNKDKLKDKGLIAWDYCRITQITGWSYVAGYISIDEAYDILIDAAKELQKTYSSWEDMSEHYMLGFEFWSGQDKNNEKTEAYRRHQLNQKILKDEKSPFTTLPWNLDLNKIK
ncbi:DUF1266 domain-containing protein [Proteiniborus sp.]|uniref:DUF1266 domain-containing protein n=1 Tax=Proteiniborus sp. TaxID=2079015 RepID=UPI00332B757A